MKSYTLAQYGEAGCPEIADIIGIALYSMTDGRICDTGCGSFDDGKCSAFLKLTAGERGPLLATRPKEIKYTETVRAEAARRNMSIKKVRAERRDKANEETL